MYKAIISNQEYNVNFDKKYLKGEYEVFKKDIILSKKGSKKLKQQSLILSLLIAELLQCDFDFNISNSFILKVADKMTDAICKNLDLINSSTFSNINVINNSGVKKIDIIKGDLLNNQRLIGGKNE